MKAQRTLGRLALLLAFAAGLAGCGDAGNDDSTDSDQTPDDDNDAVDDDSDNDDDNDDDDDDNDDDDDTDDDDDDDTAHEVDRFSANGIDYQLIAGGDPGGDGISLTTAPDGRVRVAAVKARQLYLFTEDEGKGWTREIVALWSENPDLHADPDGHLHLVFQDKANWRLVYATDAAGWWTFTPIVSMTYLHAGAYASLALDHNRAVHVVFQNAAAYDLMYATNASGAWRLRRLFMADAVSERPAIAIDAQNRPHAAYQDHMKHKVFHAIRDGGEWRREEAATTETPGAESQLALRLDGKAHVAFDAENMLRLASENDDGWTAQTVDTEWSDSISLALDASDAANLSYRLPSGLGENDILRFASNTGGEWAFATVDQGKDVGWPSDLCLDADGVARIAYHSGGEAALRLATREGRGWTSETVDQANLAGQVKGLTLDEAAKARLVYYDFGLSQYTQGVESPGGWSFAALAAPADIAYRSSWLLAPAGEIQTLGLASDFGPLTYASYAHGAWTTEDAAQRVYWFTSPALDENGAMHFVCRSRNPLDWRYVTNASGAWVSEPMDVSPAPVWPAFAYANGAPRAAYVSDADEWIMYAWRESGAWSVERAPEADTADRVEGVAVDADDTPHIIYSVKDFWVGYHLRYLTKRGGDWVVEEIFETDNSTCVFALDETNRVHALFFDIVTDDVKYATNVSGSWTTAVIDEVGQSGSTLALALRDGQVHAAYSDESAVWYAVFPQGYGVR